MICSSVVGIAAVVLCFTCVAGAQVVATADNNIDVPADFHELEPSPPTQTGDPISLQPEPPALPQASPVAIDLRVAAVMGVLAIVSVTLLLQHRRHRLPALNSVDRTRAILLYGFLGLVLAQGIGGFIALRLLGLSNESGTTGSANPEGAGLRAGVLVRLGAYFLTLPFLAILFSLRARWRRQESLAGHASSPMNPAKLVLTGGIALLLVWPLLYWVALIAALLQSMISGAPSDAIAHETLDELIDPANGIWRWIMLGVVVIITPIVEEVGYRGMLQESLKHLIGSRWAAIAITAAIFAAMHISVVEPHAVATLAALGVAFGWLYERTNSLLAPIVMHGAFNLANVLLALMIDSRATM